MSAEWEDPEPWITEDGKRQNTSVVPFRFGAKTYADYKPRTREEYETEEWVDPKPWVAWGVRYPNKLGSTYYEPRTREQYEKDISPTFAVAPIGAGPTYTDEQAQALVDDYFDHFPRLRELWKREPE